MPPCAAKPVLSSTHIGRKPRATIYADKNHFWPNNLFESTINKVLMERYIYMRIGAQAASLAMPSSIQWQIGICHKWQAKAQIWGAHCIKKFFRADSQPHAKGWCFRLQGCAASRLSCWLLCAFGLKMRQKNMAGHTLCGGGPQLRLLVGQ